MQQQRFTKQKQTIVSVLNASLCPLLPKELLLKAQKTMPQMGIATVFRHLKKMVQVGEVKVVNVAGDSPRYERSNLDHHHHFKCGECHRVFDVPGCAGNLDQLVPKGFELAEHQIILFGRCADCSDPSNPTLDP